MVDRICLKPLLHVWSHTLFFSQNKIVDNTEYDMDPTHQNTVVHILCCCRRDWWPDAPKEVRTEYIHTLLLMQLK